MVIVKFTYNILIRGIKAMRIFHIYFSFKSPCNVKECCVGNNLVGACEQARVKNI